MVELLLNEGKLVLISPVEHAPTCRDIVGGKWNKKTRIWEYPISSGPEILRHFKDVGIKMDDVVMRMIEQVQLKMKRIAGLQNRTIEPREHAFLMKHQRICVDISREANRYAFFLDTGKLSCPSYQ